MDRLTLTNADFERAARRLRCSVAAIMAVAEVESRGKGFYSDGFPTLLFERHIFRKFTQGRYNRSHPQLSGPAGNYGAAGQNQRNKFNAAFALNPDAAMKSCSWGKFQIMGFNYSVCGFATVGAFVDAMKESEGRHLDAFAEFVENNNLARYLRSLNWAAFANGYNGAGYRKNKYDTKMASAYAKYSKNSNSSKISAADQTARNQPTSGPPDTSSALTTTGESATDETSPNDDHNNKIADTVQINEGDTASVVPPTSFIAEDKVITAPAKDGATATTAKTTILGITVPAGIYAVVKGLQEWVEKGFIDVKEIAAAILDLIRNNVKYVSILVGLVVVVVIVKKIFKQITFLLQVWIAARPDMHNVTVIPAPPIAVRPRRWWMFWK